LLLGSTPLTPAGCASGYVGRRRTDLMPTIPSRDSPFAASRKSLNHSPGRAYSMSRLDQLAKPRKRPDLPAVVETTYSFRPLSSPRQSSVTRSMSHLAVSKAVPTQNRRLLNKADSRSMHQLSVDGPTIAPRTTRATQLRQQKLLASSNCSEGTLFLLIARYNNCCRILRNLLLCLVLQGPSTCWWQINLTQGRFLD
jgi:hypothetical protein